MSNSVANEINLALHPKQGLALEATATEILYGGAAGGGKSHLMRCASILWCSTIPGLQVYLFRRIKEDLIKNHVEGPKGFRSMLAPWVVHGFCKILDEEIRFWNGSKIYLCHCKDEKHRFKYLGAEIHVLLIDELTTFSEIIYRFLRSRVRAVGLPKLKKEYKGKFPRILCSSNPGNIGHLWVKKAFIDGVVPMDVRKMADSDGGMTRQYIPAKLSDNPSMTNDDPDYRLRLKGLGSESLVRAMEDGDWDVVEGAFFDCWCEDNILRPFQIPTEWLRFRSFDWGSSKPFSVGWWAVVTDDYPSDNGLLPRGALVRYREWYGSKRDNAGLSLPNEGLKMTAGEVAIGIQSREKGERMSYGVADPSIFSEDGGPSIAERMRPVIFKKADNKRVAARGRMGGWDQMRSRIKGDERPMIYVFNTCVDSIRTIPALQHDTNLPEDLDTNAEDHAADEWRYACMSRPWILKQPKTKEEKVDLWGRRFKGKKAWKLA